MVKFDLKISKIATGVPGFDDLFFGGLRLPDFKEDKEREGICIVIYGERGVSKSDLAMQIMRGVDEFLRTKTDTNSLRSRYTTLNHRESELKKKYVGFEVSKVVDDIKFGMASNESKKTDCRLCEYFPDLKEAFKSIISTDCIRSEYNNCPICKLMSHEVINYSDNSQTINWTYGHASDSSNLIATINDSVVDKNGIFDLSSEYNNTHSQYSSSALIKFKEISREVYKESISKRSETNQADKSNSRNNFKWNSYVIEGFTAFNDEELGRLPLADLIARLRKTTAVSILVFDERGRELHLNADILIHMRFKTDEEFKYSYYQLQVVKSDLQQHAHGWHLYRKQRDLSVKIYPSMHYLLHRRFTSENAILRLEQNYMLYPQTLRDKVDLKFAQRNINNEDNESKVRIVNELLSAKTDRGTVFQSDTKLFDLDIICSDNDYNDMLRRISFEAEEDETTVAFFLLGKSEYYIREKLSQYIISANALCNIKVWESGMGCIWAEEYSSILKDYISRWKESSPHKKLHIILDDFANINMFPLMEKERLLVPVLYNICRNAVAYGGYDGNDRGIRIKLTFVCSNPSISIYREINQIVENQ